MDNITTVWFRKKWTVTLALLTPVEKQCQMYDKKLIWAKWKKKKICSSDLKKNRLVEGDKKIPSDGECVLYHLQNIFLCTVSLNTATLRLLGRENRILSIFLQIKKLKSRLSQNHLKMYSYLMLNPGFRPQVSDCHNRVYLHYTLLML